MKEQKSEVKTVRLITISVITAMLLVYSAFAISGIGKNAKKNDSSSALNSIGDIRDYISEDAAIISDQKISSQHGSDTCEPTDTAIISESSKTVSDHTNCECYRDPLNTVGIRWGFVWMKMECMRLRIDTLGLRKHDVSLNYNTDSSVYQYLDSDEFFGIMETLKKYDWIGHKEYINFYQINHYQLTVIGSNMVYTYLTFARDENGKGFVYSSYDDQIVYPSEEDYMYFEKILENAAS